MQQLSAARKSVGSKVAIWQLSGGNLQRRYKITNVEINFINFRCSPLHAEKEREGNIFVIRLESRAEICGLKGIET